jgi:hypothetical protein
MIHEAFATDPTPDLPLNVGFGSEADALVSGCHLNRAIEDVIKRAGFSIEQLDIDKGCLTGLKIMTFMYEGLARTR